MSSGGDSAETFEGGVSSGIALDEDDAGQSAMCCNGAFRTSVLAAVNDGAW